MKPRGSYVNDLAQTVDEMIATGTYNMDTLEICKEHFPRHKRLGKATVEEVRRLLPHIKRVLINTYNHDVCLVNTYFFNHGRYPPNNIEEAKRCLPTTHDGRDGLWISTDKGDTIMQADLERNARSAEGKKKKSWDRAINAVCDERLPITVAHTIMSTTAKQFEPSNPALVKEIMLVLPVITEANKQRKEDIFLNTENS